MPMTLYEKIIQLSGLDRCATFAEHICSITAEVQYVGYHSKSRSQQSINRINSADQGSVGQSTTRQAVSTSRAKPNSGISRTNNKVSRSR